MSHATPQFPAEEDPTPPIALGFRRRATYVVFVAAATAATLFLVWHLRWTLALVFGAILVGVFFRTGGDLVARLIPGRHKNLGLAGFCVLLVLLGTLFAAFAVPGLSGQMDELRDQVPKAVESLRGRLEDTGWGRWLLDDDRGGDLQGLVEGGGGMMQRAMTAASTLLTVVVSFVFLLFTGLYLAVEPREYRRGIVWLLPPRDREAAQQTLLDVGHTLRYWLYGQLTAMALVGILSGVGLWILGVPLPLVCAVWTFLLVFIPNFGPVASGALPVLLALATPDGMFGGGVGLALAVVVLYLGVQAVESYVVTPMIQKKAVELPPALLITTQLILGVLMGLVGVAIAAPLTAALMVASRRLLVVGDPGNPDETPTGEFAADEVRAED